MISVRSLLRPTFAPMFPDAATGATDDAAEGMSDTAIFGIVIAGLAIGSALTLGAHYGRQIHDAEMLDRTRKNVPLEFRDRP